MNLTRALDVALPEIPARTLSQRPSRLDPKATFREHVEDGARVVRVYIPSSGYMFKLAPAQWALAQLFDGTRSYSEIAELYSQQTGEFYDEQAISEFSSELESAGLNRRASGTARRKKRMFSCCCRAKKSGARI